mgnify:CR=1 FL=1
MNLRFIKLKRIFPWEYPFFACHSIFSIMKIYNSGEEIRIMNRKIMDLIVKIILTIFSCSSWDFNFLHCNGQADQLY